MRLFIFRQIYRFLYFFRRRPKVFPRAGALSGVLWKGFRENIVFLGRNKTRNECPLEGFASKKGLLAQPLPAIYSARQHALSVLKPSATQ
jgi:hypothetical protein